MDPTIGFNFISIIPTVVLTTHSMEGAEELCSRLEKRADGQMRCIESAQHLKGTFIIVGMLDSQFKSMASPHVIDLVSNIIEFISSQNLS